MIIFCHLKIQRTLRASAFRRSPCASFAVCIFCRVHSLPRARQSGAPTPRKIEILTHAILLCVFFPCHRLNSIAPNKVFKLQCAYFLRAIFPLCHRLTLCYANDIHNSNGCSLLCTSFLSHCPNHAYLSYLMHPQQNTCRISCLALFHVVTKF